MEHFIVITGGADIMFAQAPPIERQDACYMGYDSHYAAPIASVHADRTFDWATDDAWESADAESVDHQVWHIVDGVVIAYQNCVI